MAGKHVTISPLPVQTHVLKSPGIPGWGRMAGAGRISMMEPRIRAVVFREGDWWIIQILEYDLVTQVRHLEDVPGEFRRLLTGQMAANAASGVEPFHGFSAAPRRFWKMYERAQALVTPTPLEEMESEALPRYEARLAA